MTHIERLPEGGVPLLFVAVVLLIKWPPLHFEVMALGQNTVPPLNLRKRTVPLVRQLEMIRAASSARTLAEPAPSHKFTSDPAAAISGVSARTVQNSI